jgi:maleate cis-trans isomerase
MKIDAEDLQTNETDDRGRIYLGTEYANKRVTVAVVEVESKESDEEELAAAYREASESASELADEWSDSSDEAWDTLDE